jgi:hypothetical protein
MEINKWIIKEKYLEEFFGISIYCVTEIFYVVHVLYYKKTRTLIVFVFVP